MDTTTATHLSKVTVDGSGKVQKLVRNHSSVVDGVEKAVGSN